MSYLHWTERHTFQGLPYLILTSKLTKFWNITVHCAFCGEYLHTFLTSLSSRILRKKYCVISGEGRRWFEQPESWYDSLNYGWKMKTKRVHPRLQRTMVTNCMQPLAPLRHWPLESTCPVYDMAVPCFSRESPSWQNGGNHSDGNFAVLKPFIRSHCQ